MSGDSRETFQALLRRRLSRRRLIDAGIRMAALPALLPAAGCGSTRASAPSFTSITGSSDDGVVVPPGYRADVLLRWGDPLVAGAAALDPGRVASGALLEPDAADAQARQFGFNCDGLALFPLAGQRVLACVNHEFPIGSLMFPGMREAFRARSGGPFAAANPECVAVMQAAVGVSVVELAGELSGRYVAGSGFNRRITARTPMQLSGPARGHPLFRSRGDPLGGRVLGTFANCAAGSTPWGTYLTAEENVDDYFGNGNAADLEPEVAAAHRRMSPRGRDSIHRWEYVDPRFDVQRNPRELLKFGWIVEIDPYDAARTIRKRTALGRFKHEGATTVVAPDGRAVVYMGDDAPFEYLYKFVSAEPFDPARPERNRDLLDTGTLYVARFRDDGSGEWAPLAWGEQAALSPARGFNSQGDVVLRCREAADLLGATPLDRPEDIAVSPLTGRVYLACTQNSGREGAPVEAEGRYVDGSADAVNPRSPNRFGHVLELLESGDDPTASAFRWEVFLLAGDPAGDRYMTSLAFDEPLPPDATFYGGHPPDQALSPFAGPDNLGFDPDGHLWIVTDGDQPRGHNNGCFVCPTDGSERGAVRQFMSGPVGAEICGCEFSADGQALYLTVQHPGSGGSATAPISHWPDGGDNAPRSSLIVITTEDGRPFGS